MYSDRLAFLGLVPPENVGNKDKNNKDKSKYNKYFL